MEFRRFVLAIILLGSLTYIYCIELLPYGGSDGQLYGDDQCTKVQLESPMKFFNKTYNELFVCTNGLISFNSAVVSFTPTAFPISNQPIFAAFWADCYPRATSPVYFGSRNLTTERLARFSNAFNTNLQQGVFTNAFLVTYIVKGYGLDTNLWNHFQLEVIWGPQITLVAYRYARIDWTAGTASNGVSGQVGFDAGDGINYFAIPESRTPAVTSLPNISNVGSPGEYYFSVNDNEILRPPALYGPYYTSPLPGPLCSRTNGEFTLFNRASEPLSVNVTSIQKKIENLQISCNGTLDSTFIITSSGNCSISYNINITDSDINLSQKSYSEIVEFTSSTNSWSVLVQWSTGGKYLCYPPNYVFGENTFPAEIAPPSIISAPIEVKLLSGTAFWGTIVVNISIVSGDPFTGVFEVQESWKVFLSSREELVLRTTFSEKLMRLNSGSYFWFLTLDPLQTIPYENYTNGNNWTQPLTVLEPRLPDFKVLEFYALDSNNEITDRAILGASLKVILIIEVLNATYVNLQMNWPFWYNSITLFQHQFSNNTNSTIESIVRTSSFYYWGSFSENPSTLELEYTIDIPSFITLGIDYFLRAQVDSTDTIWESNETNNQRNTTIIIDPPTWDMVILSINNTFGGLYKGIPGEVSMIVNNQIVGGNGRRFSWYDCADLWKLSENNSTDTFIQRSTRFYYNIPIGDNSSYVTQFLFSTNRLTMGQYYFIGKTDCDNNIPETIEENNGKLSTTFNLFSCGDNLCSPSFGEDCFSCEQDCGTCCGDDICQFEHESCFSCPGDCGQCCNNSICDTRFGESCANCPGDCGLCSFPEGISPLNNSVIPGQVEFSWNPIPLVSYYSLEYFLGDVKDQITSISSTLEYLTRTFPGDIKISWRVNAIILPQTGLGLNSTVLTGQWMTFETLPRTDLVVTDIKASGTILGERVTVSYTIKNIGGSPTFTSWLDTIYFSDGIGFYYAGQAMNPVFLLPQESYTNSISFVIPMIDSFRVPTILIRVLSDSSGSIQEQREDNNELTETFPLSLPPLPDLIVPSCSTLPSSLSGQEVPVSFTISNIESKSFDGSIYFTVTLLNVSSLPVTELQSSIDIIPYQQWGNATVVTKVILPRFGSGTFRISISADTFNYLFERDETNNKCQSQDLVVIPAPLPKLVVSNAFIQSDLISNREFTLNYTVTNIGTGSILYPYHHWRDRISLTPENSTSKVVSMLNYLQMEIPPGESYNSLASLFIPEDWNFNFSEVHIELDYYSELPEANESSHEYILEGIQVQWLPPDFHIENVSIISLNNPVNSGDEITIEYWVRNIGLGNISNYRSQSWTDRIKLRDSDDDLISTFSLRRDQSIVWMSGDFKVFRLERVRIPVSSPTGLFKVEVEVNFRKDIMEFSYEDNKFNQVFQVEFLAADLLPLPVVVNSTFEAGVPKVINYCVLNSGTRTATHRSDGVFLLDSSSISYVLSGTLIGSSVILDPLYQNSTSCNHSIEILIPRAISGTIKLILVIDYLNWNLELSKDNNQQFINSLTFPVENNITATPTSSPGSIEQPITITVLPPQSRDLIESKLFIDSTDLEKTPTLEIFEGKPVLISWNTQNLGTKTLNFPWIESIYVSGKPWDQERSRDIILRGKQQEETLRISSGYSSSESLVKSIERTGIILLPNGTIRQSHRISFLDPYPSFSDLRENKTLYLTLIIDPYDSIIETNETNNFISYPFRFIPRDIGELSASKIEMTQESSSEGETMISVNWEVKNVATGGTDSSIRSDFWLLSSNLNETQYSNFTPPLGSIFLGSIILPPIPGNFSLNGTTIFPKPSSLIYLRNSTSFFPTLYLDTLNVLPQVNRSKLILINSTTPLIIEGNELPDDHIIIDSLIINGHDMANISLLPYEEITLEYQANFSVPGSFGNISWSPIWDLLVLSNDQTFQDGVDLRILEKKRERISGKYQITFTIPKIISGNYYLGMILNSRKSPEMTFSNNIAWIGFNIGTLIPSNLILHEISANIVSESNETTFGQPINFTWTYFSSSNSRGLLCDSIQLIRPDLSEVPTYNREIGSSKICGMVSLVAGENKTETKSIDDLIVLPGSYYSRMKLNTDLTIQETNLFDNIATSINTIKFVIPQVQVPNIDPINISLGIPEKRKSSFWALNTTRDGETMNIEISFQGITSYDIFISVSRERIPSSSDFDYSLLIPSSNENLNKSFNFLIDETFSGIYYLKASIITKDIQNTQDPAVFQVKAYYKELGIVDLSPNFLSYSFPEESITYSISGTRFKSTLESSLICQSLIDQQVTRISGVIWRSSTTKIYSTFSNISREFLQSTKGSNVTCFLRLYDPLAEGVNTVQSSPLRIVPRIPSSLSTQLRSPASARANRYGFMSFSFFNPGTVDFGSLVWRNLSSNDLTFGQQSTTNPRKLPSSVDILHIFYLENNIEIFAAEELDGPPGLLRPWGLASWSTAALMNFATSQNMTMIPMKNPQIEEIIKFNISTLISSTLSDRFPPNSELSLVNFTRVLEILDLLGEIPKNESIADILARRRILPMENGYSRKSNIQEDLSLLLVSGIYAQGMNVTDQDIVDYLESKNDPLNNKRDVEDVFSTTLTTTDGKNVTQNMIPNKGLIVISTHGFQSSSATVGNTRTVFGQISDAYPGAALSLVFDHSQGQKLPFYRYIESSDNTFQAAMQLSEFIIQNNIDPSRLVLIGHSNGAWVMARTAKILSMLKKPPIQELVLLDPAGGKLGQLSPYNTGLSEYKKYATRSLGIGTSLTFGQPINPYDLFADNVLDFKNKFFSNPVDSHSEANYIYLAGLRARTNWFQTRGLHHLKGETRVPSTWTEEEDESLPAKVYDKIFSVAFLVTVIKFFVPPPYKLAITLAQWSFTLILSRDPNDIVVQPPGYGNDFQWIQSGLEITIRIRFENAATLGANGPAQIVTLDFPVSPFLDITSLKFTSFGFGNSTFSVHGSGIGYFQQLELLNPGDLGNVGLQVIGRVENSRILAQFTSLDRQTFSLPLDPEAGFLLPEDGTGRGNGFLEFTAEIKPNIPTGSNITFSADIIFDQNEPISTPVVYRTADSGEPTARLTLDQNTIPSTESQLTLDWRMTDDGSGVKLVSIWVSEGSSTELPPISSFTILDTIEIPENISTSFGSTKVSSLLFKEGITYYLMALAEDFVGQKQGLPSDGSEQKRDAIKTFQKAINPCEITVLGGNCSPYNLLENSSFTVESLDSQICFSKAEEWFWKCSNISLIIQAKYTPSGEFVKFPLEGMTISPTSTLTETPTISPTMNSTSSSTSTSTLSQTATLSNTATSSPTNSMTLSNTHSPSLTPSTSPSFSPSPSSSPSHSPSHSPSSSSSPTPSTTTTATSTPSVSPSSTSSYTSTPTSSPSTTHTVTPTPSTTRTNNVSSTAEIILVTNTSNFGTWLLTWEYPEEFNLEKNTSISLNIYHVVKNQQDLVQSFNITSSTVELPLNYTTPQYQDEEDHIFFIELGENSNKLTSDHVKVNNKKLESRGIREISPLICSLLPLILLFIY